MHEISLQMKNHLTSLNPNMSNVRRGRGIQIKSCLEFLDAACLLNQNRQQIRNPWTKPDMVMLAIPALRKERKDDRCIFETSLVYVETYRPARAT